MMLPPVRLFKYATPVKAKTSAPLPLLHTTCAALTWRGLGKLTRTGSRGRGRGLRQTLDRRLGGRLAVGRRDVCGPFGRLRWGMVFHIFVGRGSEFFSFTFSTGLGGFAELCA
jgi:hypothetical protein